MAYTDRWEQIRLIGEGGQGKVFLARKAGLAEIQKLQERFETALFEATRGISIVGVPKKVFDCAREICRLEASELGALKLLHDPIESKSPDRITAEKRIEREINAMTELSHPNLLRILDKGDKKTWFVSDYHSAGTLKKHTALYTGDVLRALQAIRPLIAGVAVLHKAHFVHRDIKPDNVFIGANGDLILGDFGLVFFEDPAHTRVSETFENIGSWEWMPPWAVGIKVDDVRPSFDVFSLGKLLWSMISGRPRLLFWYFKQDANNLEKIFPGQPEMRLINNLLERCVVEHENQVLYNTSDLLNEVDTLISRLRSIIDVAHDLSIGRCRICGQGTYKPIEFYDADDSKVFALLPTSKTGVEVLRCTHCGNVQLFMFDARRCSGWPGVR